MKRIGFLLTIGLFLFNNPLYSQDLVSSERLQRFTKEEMNQIFPVLVQYNVDLYKIQYTTTDLNNALDTASGLVVVPLSDEGTLAWPLLSYAHGTVGSKQDVPSNLEGGYQLAMFLGASGYVTAAADFLGLGDSRGFHPYLHAETEASASIDMLYATQQFAAEKNILLNQQLFITGYSQGGHVAMATHQVLEEQLNNDFTVTASAPMSGPYSVSGAFRDLLLGDEPYGYPIYIAYTALSYNIAYDLGYEVSDFFKEPYSEILANALDEDIDLLDLNEALIDSLTREVGSALPRALLQDSLADLISNQLDHPINQALRDNDTFNWVPQAPTRLFYCTADDQVGFRNSVIADSILNENGAVDLESMDVDTDADHGECVIPATFNTLIFFEGFKAVIVSNESLFSATKDLEVFPNPVMETLVIREIPADGRLQVFDSAGKLLWSRQFEVEQMNYEIDLGHLSSGMYIIQYANGVDVVSKKFVKN